MYTHTHTYIYFFRFFSIIGYYKILNIIPCALQSLLFIYFICNYLVVGKFKRNHLTQVPIMVTADVLSLSLPIRCYHQEGIAG